jgi:hypothetical protein
MEYIIILSTSRCLLSKITHKIVLKPLNSNTLYKYKKKIKSTSQQFTNNIVGIYFNKRKFISQQAYNMIFKSDGQTRE